MENWRVSENFTYGDHQAIWHCIGKWNLVVVQRTKSCKWRWKSKAFDRDLFVETLQVDSGQSDVTAEKLMDAMVRACGTNMPRRLELWNKRRQAYW